MPQFLIQDGCICSSKITGPRHCFLGLALSSRPVNQPELIMRFVPSDGTRRVDWKDIIPHVASGVAAACDENFRHLFAKIVITYGDDRPGPEHYEMLAYEITRHIIEQGLVDVE